MPRKTNYNNRRHIYADDKLQKALTQKLKKSGIKQVDFLNYILERFLIDEAWYVAMIQDFMNQKIKKIKENKNE